MNAVYIVKNISLFQTCHSVRIPVLSEIPLCQKFCPLSENCSKKREKHSKRWSSPLYHQVPLGVPAQLPADHDHCRQPEYLQKDGPVHLRAGQVAAVDAQGHVLHGGEGEQLHHLSYFAREERQRDIGPCQEIHQRGAHPPDSVGGYGVETGYVDQHDEGHRYQHRQRQGQKEKEELRRAGRGGEPVGGGQQNGHRQDRDAAQPRGGEPRGRAPGEPQAIDAHRPAELIGDIPAAHGVQYLAVEYSGGEHGDESLLEPDVGTGGFHGHGVRGGVGVVESMHGGNLHEAPEELCDDAAEGRSPVLQPHDEPHSEIADIFFHERRIPFYNNAMD